EVGVAVDSLTDDESTVDGDAGPLADEHVVELPPPAERGHDAPAHLHRRLSRRLRECDLHEARPARTVHIVPKRCPGRAAVETEVEIAELAGERTVIA